MRSNESDPHLPSSTWSIVQRTLRGRAIDAIRVQLIAGIVLIPQQLESLQGFLADIWRTRIVKVNGVARRVGMRPAISRQCAFPVVVVRGVDSSTRLVVGLHERDSFNKKRCTFGE
jgi:hypothetical protein